jgi:MoxR-like ATPase
MRGNFSVAGEPIGGSDNPVQPPSHQQQDRAGIMTTTAALSALRAFIGERIIGQQRLIDRLLIALLADGHLLVEGAPGLAKTRAIKVLGEGIEGEFHRIQFTPDLLPADLTGTEIYRPQDGSFKFQQGPLFHNLVLADEINRAPAKVQSALLEAMAERQITIGRETYPLPELFLVMATQNPLEQEGTYPLPEAQLDRFLMHVTVGYPAQDEERQILALARDEARLAIHSTHAPQVILPQAKVFEARRDVLNVHMSSALEQYVLALIFATRNPAAYGQDLTQWVQYGASPRATIALDRCARAHAWLAGRDYVNPADVQAIAPDVLRHRVILNYEAVADGVTTDRFIDALLSRVPVP